MKKCLLLKLFVVTVFFGTAQVDPMGDFNRHVFESWKGEVVRIGQYAVKGSPYFFGSSFPGEIKYQTGRILRDTRILYDLYHQKAGVELKSQIYEANELVETFSVYLPEKFGGQQLVFKNSYVFGKPSLNCYFNVLQEGDKVALLKMYKSKLVADPTNTMDTKMKVFEQYYEYYIYNKKEQTLNNVKLRKKDIVRELGDEQFLSGFPGKDALNFTKEFDVITAFEAYNNHRL
jgi:hypothetical protein